MQECKINTEMEALIGRPASPLDGSPVCDKSVSSEFYSHFSCNNDDTDKEFNLCGRLLVLVCIYLGEINLQSTPQHIKEICEISSNTGWDD